MHAAAAPEARMATSSMRNLSCSNEREVRQHRERLRRQKLSHGVRQIMAAPEGALGLWCGEELAPAAHPLCTAVI